MRKKRISINTKLSVAFLLALLVPTILIASNAFFAAKKEITTQIEHSATQSVQTLEDVIQQYVGPIVKEAAYFGKTLDVEKEGKTIILERLAQYYETSDGTVSSFIGTTTGETYQYPDLGLMSNKDFDPRTRDWYKEAMASPGDVIISEPHEAASTGDWVITISKKLDNKQGVFATNLNLSNLHKMVTAVTIGNEGYPVLLSEQGMVIAHPTLATGELTKDEPWATTMLKQDNPIFTTDIHNKEAHIISHHNALTNWHLGGIMFTQEVDEAVAPIYKTIIIVLAGSLIVLGIYIYYVIRSIVKPLRTMRDIADEMSEGDLRHDLTWHTRDEIGSLSRAFSKMGEMLSSIIRHIQHKTTSVLAASEELSATAEDSAKATERIADAMSRMQEGFEQQVIRVDQGARAIDDVAADIQSIYEHTKAVTTHAKTAEETADKGHQIVQSTETQMRKIEGTIQELSQDIGTMNDYAKEIDAIVTVITNISEQTNLLALNAAIEAARAGEEGKGFAVVADEVRHLAEQTNQSSAQVSDIVTAIQRESTRSVDSMQRTSSEVTKGLTMFTQTEENFVQVKRFIETITEQLAQVLTNAKKIAHHSQGVKQDMEGITQITQQNRDEMHTIAEATEEQLSAMEELTATAETLEASMEELEQQITRFELKAQ